MRGRRRRHGRDRVVYRRGGRRSRPVGSEQREPVQQRQRHREAQRELEVDEEQALAAGLDDRVQGGGSPGVAHPSLQVGTLRTRGRCARESASRTSRRLERCRDGAAVGEAELVDDVVLAIGAEHRRRVVGREQLRQHRRVDVLGLGRAGSGEVGRRDHTGRGQDHAMTRIFTRRMEHPSSHVATLPTRVYLVRDQEPEACLQLDRVLAQHVGGIRSSVSDVG